MPTYEYTCSSCDARHEIVQKMSDPTLTECPSCGQPTLRKLFNGVGVVFKGSGFYRTDSRSSGSASEGSSKGSGGAEQGEKKSSTKDSGSSSSSGTTSGSSSSSSSSSSGGSASKTSNAS
ncbi:FmdB family transcriptional regulator [bacterium]|nr:FmdB family transcriptional regulator [bacterium]